MKILIITCLILCSILFAYCDITEESDVIVTEHSSKDKIIKWMQNISPIRLSTKELKTMQWRGKIRNIGGICFAKVKILESRRGDIEHQYNFKHISLPTNIWTSTIGEVDWDNDFKNIKILHTNLNNFKYIGEYEGPVQCLYWFTVEYHQDYLNFLYKET